MILCSLGHMSFLVRNSSKFPLILPHSYCSHGGSGMAISIQNPLMFASINKCTQIIIVITGLFDYLAMALCCDSFWITWSLRIFDRLLSLLPNWMSVAIGTKDKQNGGLVDLEFIPEGIWLGDPVAVGLIRVGNSSLRTMPSYRM